MTVCLNPACPHPQNPDDGLYCQACGTGLILGDRYQAMRLIGQGGFGRTFYAIDRSAPPENSACIIKQLLSRGFHDPVQTHQRFQQEVDRLTELGEHPQIPKLLAHFVDEASQYLIQEWIEGQNLELLLLQQGVFNEGQVRQLLADLLPVLRFVHRHQVIHRDIKPANIIQPSSQTTAPRSPYVLVDFGASKAVTETNLAKTGTTIGSAGYVAPEQAMGKATFASDLYSLGVTCIHLLTGLHPFDLYSISDDCWIWRQYLTQPISMELRRVLDTMLQRATSQRYKDATAVLQALRLEAAPVPSTQVAEQVSDKISIAVGQSASRLPVQTVQPTDSPTQPHWFCRKTLIGHQGEVTAIAVSPNGKWIASGSTDRSIRLWNLDGDLLHTWMGQSLRFGNGHRGTITALTFSPNSRVLISASSDGLIKQWDVRSGEHFCNLSGQSWGIAAIALSPCEPLLASGSQDGLIQLWDLETEELIDNVVQLHQPITALQIDAKGRSLWSNNGKAISQWNLSDDRLMTSLKGHLEGVSAIALSADGCTLISGGTDKLLKLWNLNTGQQQKLIAAHRDPIHDLAIHPQEPIFASASEDGTIKLWNLWTGDRIITLRHAWGVNAIAFMPDGQQLVSGSADETLKIWQQET